MAFIVLIPLLQQLCNNCCHVTYWTASFDTLSPPSCRSEWSRKAWINKMSNQNDDDWMKSPPSPRVKKFSSAIRSICRLQISLNVMENITVAKLNRVAEHFHQLKTLFRDCFNATSDKRTSNSVGLNRKTPISTITDRQAASGLNSRWVEDWSAQCVWTEWKLHASSTLRVVVGWSWVELIENFELTFRLSTDGMFTILGVILSTFQKSKKFPMGKVAQKCW